jgi:hypothetical protein
LSNALRAQKNAKDESCQIALGNLRTQVIRLSNEALEKDKILLSLVDMVKASCNTQFVIVRNNINREKISPYVSLTLMHHHM